MMKSRDSQRVQQPEKEQRRSSRLTTDSLLYLRIAPNNGGFLRDLSEGGMCITVANPLVASAKVHFSIILAERQLVEGTGIVSWVSESGRRVGIQFIRFPEESLMRLWQRLGARDAPTQSNQAPRDSVKPVLIPPPGPGADIAARSNEPKGSQSLNKPIIPVAVRGAGKHIGITDVNPSGWEQQPTASQTIFSPPPPRPDAMPSQEISNASSRNQAGGLNIPTTPLFFLTGKKDSEDEQSRVSSEWTPGPAAEAGNPSNRWGESATSATTSADGQESNREEETEKRRKPRWGKFMIAAVLCAILIVMSPNLRNYFSALARFVQPRLAASSLILSPPVETSRFQPSDQSQNGTSRASVRNRRGHQAARNGTIAHSLRGNGGDSTVEAAASRPLSSPAAETGTQSLNSSTQGSFASSSTDLAETPDSRTGSLTRPVFNGLMATLRNDGPSVEEGVPIPVHGSPDNGTFAPTRIVLDAVIGMDGRVKKVSLVSSQDPTLTAAVMETVKHWQYRPRYQNGEPVEFTTRITVVLSEQTSKP